MDQTPVVGWKAAQAHIGVSRRTMFRRRNERGDQTRPWWRDREALLDWWQALLEAK